MQDTTNNVFEVQFLKRPNRFLAILDLDGIEIEAFVPNPGRMYEFTVPGKRMFVREAKAPHRRTDYDLIAVDHEGILVSIDSNQPNRFIKMMLTERKLPFFGKYTNIKSEPKLYEGRFDFKLDGPDGTTLIEVKSCTLVENHHAFFPDAPTERGTRHMRSLVRALHEGIANNAAVIFVVQRPDADIFSPYDPTDRKFGDALRYAAENGVEVIPLLTRLVNWELEFIKRIPHDLYFFKDE